MTTKNTEKTAVLSLRIPAALKTKLEAQAAQKKHDPERLRKGPTDRECASAFDNAARRYNRYNRDNWALFWGNVAAIAVTAVLATVVVVFVLDMTGFLQKPPQ